MQQHIPSHRWKNLPEGKIVTHMISEAALGARKVGQFAGVGQRKGTTIPIAPEDAQPERQQPTKLDECRRCELWQFATQAVGGEGPKKARSCSSASSRATRKTWPASPSSARPASCSTACARRPASTATPST
jgi:hypothetical protein